MKKNYIEPSVKVISVELQDMIALSGSLGEDVTTPTGGDAKEEDIEDILNWID